MERLSKLLARETRIWDQMYHTIFALDPELWIVYRNPAWFRFCEENGGSGKVAQQGEAGIFYPEVLPDVLRPFFTSLFRRVLDTRQEERLDYDCSSPDLYRKFRQIIRPLGAGRGLVVLNPIIVEEEWPENQITQTKNSLPYTGENGFIAQCAHCRRVRHREVPGRWDFVPALLENPQKNITHTLCEPCLEHFYPPD